MPFYVMTAHRSYTVAYNSQTSHQANIVGIIDLTEEQAKTFQNINRVEAVNNDPFLLAMFHALKKTYPFDWRFYIEKVEVFSSPEDFVDKMASKTPTAA